MRLSQSIPFTPVPPRGGCGPQGQPRWGAASVRVLPAPGGLLPEPSWRGCVLLRFDAWVGLRGHPPPAQAAHTGSLQLLTFDLLLCPVR